MATMTAMTTGPPPDMPPPAKRTDNDDQKSEFLWTRRSRQQFVLFAAGATLFLFSTRLTVRKLQAKKRAAVPPHFSPTSFSPTQSATNAAAGAGAPLRKPLKSTMSKPLVTRSPTSATSNPKTSSPATVQPPPLTWGNLLSRYSAPQIQNTSASSDAFRSSEDETQVNGPLEGVEALQLATLNVLAFAMMLIGGLGWAYDVSSPQELRTRLRAFFNLDEMNQNADEEFEEWMASVLSRKDDKQRRGLPRSKVYDDDDFDDDDEEYNNRVGRRWRRKTSRSRRRRDELDDDDTDLIDDEAERSKSKVEPDGWTAWAQRTFWSRK